MPLLLQVPPQLPRDPSSSVAKICSHSILSLQAGPCISQGSPEQNQQHVYVYDVYVYVYDVCIIGNWFIGLGKLGSPKSVVWVAG